MIIFINKDEQATKRVAEVKRLIGSERLAGRKMFIGEFRGKTTTSGTPDRERDSLC